MKTPIIILLFYGVIAGGPAAAQMKTEQHKHGEHQEHKDVPDRSANGAAKKGADKCCEGIEKMKDAAHINGEMKAKMVKMKAMKEKIAEEMKMKQTERGGPAPESKPGESKETEKSSHQH